jgi:hypothetical protein
MSGAQCRRSRRVVFVFVPAWRSLLRSRAASADTRELLEARSRRQTSDRRMVTGETAAAMTRQSAHYAPRVPGCGESETSRGDAEAARARLPSGPTAFVTSVPAAGAVR